MRPLRLRMTNFGPYVGTQEVDFERLGGHGLFLIHGPTGAGKSTVLDAMCFALFGESSGGERGAKDVVTTHARQGGSEVVLEFEHGGRTYRVKRCPEQMRPKARGSGLTRQAPEASLEDLGSRGVLASKVSEVTAKVEGLLRCDASQFRQTVVLPQGEFRKVVTDEGSRRDILANIFDTRRFKDLASALKEKHNALWRQGKANEDARREVLVGLGVASREEAEELLATAWAEVEATLEVKRLRDVAKAAAQSRQAAARSLADEFEELARTRREAAALDARSGEIEREERALALARRAAGLADSRAHLASCAQDRDDLVSALAEARRAEAEAAEALDAAVAAAAALEPERPRLEELRRRLNTLEALEPRVASAAAKGSELGAAEGRWTRAVEAARGAERRAQETETRLAEARERLERASATAAQLSDANERLAAAREALKAGRDVAGFLRELAGVEEELGAQAEGEDPLASALARIALHAPGLLAKDLVDGGGCPVCGSEEHPSPATAGGEDELTAVIRDFGSAAARVATLKQRREELLHRVHEVREARGWSASEPDEVRLKEALAAAEAAAARAETARREVAEAAAAVEALAARAQQAMAEVQTLGEGAHAAEKEVVGLRSQVEGALADLPEEHREPSAFQAALTAARSAHAELAGRFDAAAAAVAGAERAGEGAARDLRGVEGRLKTAEEKLEGQRARFEGQLAAAGFATAEELDAAALPAEEVEERQAEVDAYHHARTAAAAVIDRLDARLADAEPPDLEAIGRQLEAATEAAAVADGEWNQASVRAGFVAQQLGHHDALLKRDAELEVRKAAAKRLYDLATGQVRGTAKVDLETFVLRSIFSDVLLLGNHHLRHMTSGRYQLALRDPDDNRATGLELDVVDSFSGGASRPVRTLSGGEGFLASLSLALGLAEVAQRQSGAAEHGALFIDEGFGSLDAVALEQVVGILRHLPEAHRIVGIISHVDELKKRVPVQLLVVGGPQGSRLEARVNA